MTGEQLDLLIEYINLKIRHERAKNPFSADAIADKLSTTLAKLEASCEEGK